MMLSLAEVHQVHLYKSFDRITLKRKNSPQQATTAEVE